MLPRRIRNCFLFNLPVISLPIIAAWLLPRPGKKEAIGETRAVPIIGFIICFFSCFFIINFPIFCFGGWIFCEIE